MKINLVGKSLKIFNIDVAKRLFFIDLFFTTVCLVFSGIYFVGAPYPKMFSGIFAGCTLIVVNFLFFTFCFAFEKPDFIFTRVRYFELGNVIRKINLEFFQVVFIITWGVAFWNSPSNLYSSLFRENAISWLEEGKCEEIKKYDNEAFTLCEKMATARKTFEGPFVISHKKIMDRGLLCDYVVSDGSSDFSFPDLSCKEGNREGKVTILIKASESDSFFEDYKYSLVMKALH